VNSKFLTKCEAALLLDSHINSDLRANNIILSEHKSVDHCITTELKGGNISVTEAAVTPDSDFNLR